MRFIGVITTATTTVTCNLLLLVCLSPPETTQSKHTRIVARLRRLQSPGVRRTDWHQKALGL